ncbi:MAG: triphosphoribosyl-dephospho-CoA synthase [Sulfolobales archaeon]|nr:triphosphoribosyl-dephospho-CoA synthase [Sulfolobales archaeon]MCX8208939.1 triphosphoribosyl-dephospho-CoA synthase [Sulfolobales archaeon]MDW8011131.1 triphosphoribosyl-dephospho-CoA synthase [Sulfolobales archaeon]
MTSRSSKTRNLWRSIAQSFASALVVEVIAPKVSGVTATESIKGMTSAEFVHTSYYIYDSIENLYRDVGCVPLGRTLLDLMVSTLRDPLIRTNTCLGYGLTAISLASTILYSLRVSDCGNLKNCVLTGYGKFEECARSEDAGDLLRAVQLVNPSYHGAYYSPETLENVFKLLQESALWDLVAYNIVSGYSVTLDLYERIRVAQPGDLVDSVSKLYKFAASRYTDSISFKSGGIMLSKLVKELASAQVLSESEVRNVLVRKIGVNLGSISDIVASSIALALIEWRQGGTS